jgi:SAM-dependent methyltransferase
MTDHLTASTGRSIFGEDVLGYHRARVGYPDELYAAIASRFPANPIDAIGEIGPGTGIATAEMQRFSPQRFVAFEPDNALVAHLRTAFPAIDVIDADFVSADVEGPFDLIAAAASFHWLDPDLALTKMMRLLRPGGSVALWWNVYREAGIGDPFAEAVLPLLESIALPPSEGPTGHYSFDWKLHFARLAAAGFVDLNHTVIRRERVLSAHMVRELYASFSFVRTLELPRREGLLDAIAHIVEKQFDGAAPTIVITALYLASSPAAAVA